MAGALGFFFMRKMLDSIVERFLFLVLVSDALDSVEGIFLLGTSKTLLEIVASHKFYISSVEVLLVIRSNLIDKLSLSVLPIFFGQLGVILENLSDSKLFLDMLILLFRQ